MKKLALNKETVRALQDSELRLVTGGGYPADAALRKPGFLEAERVTALCPCGSSITDGGGGMPSFAAGELEVAGGFQMGFQMG